MFEDNAADFSYAINNQSAETGFAGDFLFEEMIDGEENVIEEKDNTDDFMMDLSTAASNDDDEEELVQDLVFTEDVPLKDVRVDDAKFFNKKNCEKMEATMKEDSTVQETSDKLLAELFNQTDHEMKMMAENYHLCRKCGLSFILEENLKVHEQRCNNLQKKYQCEHCLKTFNRQKYKDLHQKSCDKAEDSSSPPMKKVKLENNQPSTSSHQVGGSHHKEMFVQPKRIESALKQSAITYRKEFNPQNKVNLLERLQHALSTFKEVIQGELAERPGIKYYFTLKMMYHKTVDTTIL